MNQRWRIGLVMCGLIGVLPIAAEAATPDSHYYLDGSTRKLGRGVANILTSPLELIREPYLVGQRDGGFASLTVGVARGITSGIIRAGAGAIEVLTFYMSYPNHEYKPLVEPEFVFQHSEWVP